MSGGRASRRDSPAERAEEARARLRAAAARLEFRSLMRRHPAWTLAASIAAGLLVGRSCHCGRGLPQTIGPLLRVLPLILR